MCDIEKEDFKNGITEAATLLQEIMSYTTINGLDNQELENLVKYIDIVTTELYKIYTCSNPFPPCKTIEDMKLYKQLAKDLYTSLQAYCDIISKTGFESMFHDLHEEEKENTFRRISELAALSTGFMCAAKKYCIDNNIFDLMVYNKGQY